MSNELIAGFSPSRFEKNPSERVIAQKWFESNTTYKTIYSLLEDLQDSTGIKLTEREISLSCQVANMIAQWFGTPVGQGLLDSAAEQLESEGYKMDCFVHSENRSRLKKLNDASGYVKCIVPD